MVVVVVIVFVVKNNVSLTLEQTTYFKLKSQTQVRKLHNLSHLKRAALEIEKNTTIKDLYVKAMRDIIETLDHEDIIESTDETPKRVSRRRTRLRMQLRIRLKLYEAWKEWLVLRTVKKKEENWMKWAGDGDGDDDDDDDDEKHKIPFTIFRRDMERLENAPNLVSRKEIEYARCASRTSTSFCRLLFTRMFVSFRFYSFIYAHTNTHTHKRYI